MKIRNPRLLKIAGRFGTFAMTRLVHSLRTEYLPLAHPLAPRQLKPDNPARHIYSIWHENLLLPAVLFGDPSLAVLISKHADGQLLGSLIHAMGMKMVEGSTNRGGVEAIRKLIHDPEVRRHLAVTPDGPRGPRRIVQPGMIYIASRTGMSICCIGVGYRHAWRLKSWDRFAIPKPCSRSVCMSSVPIEVPPGLKTDGLERFRMMVQSEMDRVSQLAEAYAETNRIWRPTAVASRRVA